MSSIKNPTRVVVIGSSCAGKTTFASQLAATLGAKHIELDALHWEPNWKEAEDSAFKARVLSAIETDSWVVDGNYTQKIKDVVWPRAHILVWLDPPLSVILRRFFVRSITRSFRAELLWGHSRETFKNNIFSRNSLLVWILSTHKRRTEMYLNLIESPPTGTLVCRLRNKQQIAEFFKRIAGDLNIR